MSENLLDVYKAELQQHLAASGEAENTVVEEPAQEEKIEAPVSPEIEHVEVEQPVKLSLEDKARQQGWRPKEEFHGDEDEWVDAGEFVRRGTLFKKIENQSRELQEIKLVAKKLAETLSKSEERGYKKALAEIEILKNEAKNLGDVAAYEQAVQQEIQLHQERIPQAQEEFKASVPEVSQHQQEIMKKFIASNPWATRNDPEANALKQFAKDMSTQFAMKNPHLGAEEELNYVNSMLRKSFPEKYKHEIARERPAVVSGASAVRPTGGVDKGVQLSPAEKLVAEYLSRTGQDSKTYLSEVRKNSHDKR